MMSSVLVALSWLSARADVSEPQVAINRYDTCFSQHGQVACWGENAKGQLGRGDTNSIGNTASDIALILDPIDLGDDFYVKQIAGGGNRHHCAVSVDGRLKCWGQNDDGRLGYGD